MSKENIFLLLLNPPSNNIELQKIIVKHMHECYEIRKKTYFTIRYSGVRYSGLCFHIFYCNSAGLSYVVRYNGIFVIAEFVVAGCHCNLLLVSQSDWLICRCRFNK